jgi:hyperosmotically inducible protein
MRHIRNQALALALFLGGVPVFLKAQDPTPQTQPDNTRVNKQDRAAGAVTADQQKENKPDRDMTKKIRKSIVQDKTFSTYGHNVKVISRNGTVTLIGPVHDDDEKTKIESKAAEIAGRDNVKSEITVKGDTDADRSKTAH